MTTLLKDALGKDPQLNPLSLWKHFEAICTIPHPSGHEQGIIDYATTLASRHGCAISKDHVENLLISKPATNGNEDGDIIMLQCHMDMVPQANADKKHDFAIDPIIPIVDNGWIRADETTLGADNGIAVAAVFALLEDTTIQHGPLRILLTVEEESRMHGALELKTDFFDADIMINLDSEDIDEIYIACAGAVGTTAELDLTFKSVSLNDYNFYTLSVKDLEGGHSGVDIILNRGNAIKILGTALAELQKCTDINLIECCGGSLWNAIPRESSANFATSKSVDIECEIRKINDKLKAEYSETDPHLQIELNIAPQVPNVMSNACTEKIINAINICPNGFFKMSEEIQGVVETSSNLGVMSVSEGKCLLQSMQRSLVDKERDAIQSKIISAMHSTGFATTSGTSFPGWVPKPHSPIVEKCQKVYTELFKKEPKVMAIHAGLECGIIGKKHPKMDMIAIGPTMKFPHSPKEKVDIKSVEKFWNLLIRMIK